MKGLLHRLAARAAGTAARVRSDVRLPFGGGGWGEPVETQLDASALSLPAHAPSRAQAPTGHAPAGPTVVAPAPMAELRASPGSVLAADAGPPAFQAPEPHARRAATETSGDERMPPRLLAKGPDPRAHVDTPAQREDVETRREPAAVAPQPPSSARRAAPVISAPSTSRHGRVEPTRLMPAAAQRQPPAAPVSMAGQVAWAAHPPPRAATAEEPTEVHVHIGRIDVTAVPEPAAPRRRPAGAPAPMSLDSYLARRSRS